MKFAATLLIATLAASPAIGDSFSCRMGTRPACLDPGDKVCISGGMCIDSSALCYDRHQCDSEGFTCKSNVTKCIKLQGELVDDYNDLARKYNELLDENSDLVISLHEAERRENRVKACLQLANSLEAAVACSR